MRAADHDTSRFVRVRGAREHNLKNVDVDIPRDALVVFTGVSGSGKSSLAFGTLYAEAQRRYFESVSPYARRLIDQVGVPDVDAIDGLPPAVALQQQRGTPSARSSVGSVTTLSSLRAHAVLARRQLSAAAADALRRGLLAQHAAGRLPDLPRPRPRLRGDREVDGARRLADDPRARDRRLAAGLARPEPARHPGHARLRRRHAVARPAEEGRATGSSSPTSSRPCRSTPASRRPRRARALRRKTEPSYQGTFTGARKLRAAHLRDDAERADEEARRALHDRQRLPGLRRQAAQARGAVGHLRRPRHRRARRALPLGRARATCCAPAAAGRFDADAPTAATLEPRAPRARTRRAASPPAASAHAAAPDVRRTPEPVGGKAHRRAAHRRTTCVARIATLLDLGLGYLVARPQHADAVAGRAAAAAPGDADPLEPVRRRLRARRADGRPASRPTARRCSRALDAAQARRQLALRRRARPRRRCAAPTGSSTSAPTPASTAAASSTAARPPGCATVRGLAHRALPVRARREPRARTPREPARLARAARRHAQQPARPRRRASRSACSRR